GNYWSQYNGTDPDGNGIINQPYDLLGDGSAYDYHPLFFPNYNPKITLETITAILVENRTGQFINWTIEDDDYQNYIVVENGSTIIQESLDDNNVTISLDGLTQGNYTIICIVTDRWGNNGTNSVDFHVDPADYDDPFLDAPSDLLVRELDPEYEINWNASDAHPSKYNVTLNDTLYIEEDWTGGNITFTLESLEEEIYIMNLSIYDVLDHKTSQLITVNVTDFGPVIIGTDNITLAQDDTTTVKWTLYDKEPDNATIYVNEIIEDNTNIWISGGTISYEFDGNRSVGYYYVKLRAKDSENKYTNFTTTIEVLDNTYPVIETNSSNPDEIDEFDEPQVFYWNASDRNPSNYSIWLFYNGTWENILNGSWDGGNLNYTIDPAEYNISDYRLQARVTDLGGNTAISGGGGFSIVDTTLPLLNMTSPAPPTNMTLEYGSWTELKWNFSDTHPNSYQLIINNSLQVFDWNGSLITIIFENTTFYNGTNPPEDRLGNFSVTIRVTDISNNQANHTVWITIEDTTKPIISNYPGDHLDLVHISVDDHLNFSINELLPDRFCVIINGSIKVNATLGEFIIVNYALFPVGDSEIEIILTDKAGNSMLYLLNVELTDPDSPVLDEIPEDSVLVWPDHIIRLVWSVTEIRPATYKLWRNGSLVQTGPWETDIYITIDVEIGLNVFMINISDTSGNIVSDTVEITLLDINNPVIYYFQPEASMEVLIGSNLTISCQAIDEDPANYEVWLNDTLFTTGPWTSSELIEITLNLQETGYFNLILILYDNSGNNETVGCNFTVIPLPTSTTVINQKNAVFSPLLPGLLSLGLISAVITLKRKRRS
ncbi:MAG: hypothetical protein ACTSRU_14545, partial [Candidatus Hodarchaeales archaeon]